MQMMSRSDRAKQFAPFDALKGLQEAMARKEYEMGKVERIEKSPEEMERIERKLARLKKGSYVRLTCYEDGYYITVTGTVTEINESHRYLTVKDGRVYFEDIYKVDLK